MLYFLLGIFVMLSFITVNTVIIYRNIQKLRYIDYTFFLLLDFNKAGNILDNPDHEPTTSTQAMACLALYLVWPFYVAVQVKEYTIYYRAFHPKAEQVVQAPTPPLFQRLLQALHKRKNPELYI